MTRVALAAVVVGTLGSPRAAIPAARTAAHLLRRRLLGRERTLHVIASGADAAGLARIRR